MCRVGQQRSSQDMHAVLVKEAQKFCLLSFLKENKGQEVLKCAVDVSNLDEFAISWLVAVCLGGITWEN